MSRARRAPLVLETKRGIDLAAMVDIVFLLLAYFLINATLTKTPALQVDLPRSETASLTVEQTITIQILTDGQLKLNNQLIQDEALATSLKEKMARMEESNPEINIKGDRQISYERAIQVMDLLRQAGYYKYNLITSSKSH